MPAIQPPRVGFGMCESRDCSMPVPKTIEVGPELAEKIERLERQERETGAAKPADVEPEST